MDIKDMTDAYIEAIYFTDTGDSEQPAATAELDPITRMQAYLDCRNFYWAVTQDLDIEPDTLDWKQTGHDLWFTRNGHGTGFWDRRAVYGYDRCMVFSAMARAMGPHDALFKE